MDNHIVDAHVHVLSPSGQQIGISNRMIGMKVRDE
jgi:hypothetical protein